MLQLAAGHSLPQMLQKGEGLTAGIWSTAAGVYAAAQRCHGLCRCIIGTATASAAMKCSKGGELAGVAGGAS